jgi:tetratricopeptide (TPR) repeat protein
LVRYVGEEPERVARLMRFTTDYLEEPQRTDDWFVQLPEKLQMVEWVQVEAARARAARKDWLGVVNLLSGKKWTKMEDMRLVYLAQAHRELGRETEFTETWRLAVLATERNLPRITRMLELVDRWGWQTERYTLFWEWLNLTPGNTEVLNTLVEYELKRGNTANLNRIYTRLLETEPGDLIVQNNFAYTCLLLDINLSRAKSYAKTLYEANPAHPNIKTTYAFALRKQGLAKEAAELMATLNAAERSEPTRVLHCAAIQADLGNTQTATDFLYNLVEDGLLPEERSLATQIRMALSREETAKKLRNRLMDSDLNTARSAEAVGWLEIVGARGSGAPNSDLKLSDALYKDGDWVTLRELLSGGSSWGDTDHVRLALLAYLNRREGRESEAVEHWQRALQRVAREINLLNDLEALARAWNWPSERMQIVIKLLELDARNITHLDDLLSYYRERGRIADAARILLRHVKESGNLGTRAALCVYYSLLTGFDTNQAHLLAKRLNTAEPTNANITAVFGFSLWRQGRVKEAWAEVVNLAPVERAGVSVGLVQAIIAYDLGQPQEAMKRLAFCVQDNFSSDEKALAERIMRAAEADRLKLNISKENEIGSSDGRSERR